MNIRSLLSLILLFTVTFDTPLFAAKRPFDETDDSELYKDDDFCDDDKQKDDRGSRTRHEQIHSKKRPYPCRTGCDKSLSTRKSRIEHERIHSEKRPYPCQYCKETFKISGTRTRHERTHSAEKPFSCQHCTRSFKDPSNRLRHQKTCKLNLARSLLNPQQLALNQKAADDSFLTPTLDPETLSSASILVSLAQVCPTQEAQPLPLINLDADCAHILISLMQANPTQETQLVPLPNLETYNVEHYLQDNS